MTVSLPRMYAITVEAQNTRLYGMDHDPTGALWFTGSRPLLHQYRPREGRIESFPIPDGHGGSQCLWSAGKVAILPQTQPRMLLFDAATGESRHLEKPFPDANLWYGRSDKERSLFLVEERSRPCLALLDVATQAWQIVPYPPAGALPALPVVEWGETWLPFAVPGEQRRVYFDPDVRRFVAEHPGAFEPLRPGVDAPRYAVTYAEGRMTRIDRVTGETHVRPVPGWGREFGFIGGGVFWRGWQLNNLSTYNNTYRYDEQSGEYLPLVAEPDRGVDGLPYHFLDRFLAYHPESDTFAFLVPDVPPECYPQLCYNIVVDGELFITANDIWSAQKGRPLGSSEGPIGQVIVLQSARPVRDRNEPTGPVR
jgi:hypothetical protein